MSQYLSHQFTIVVTTFSLLFSTKRSLASTFGHNTNHRVSGIWYTIPVKKDFVVLEWLDSVASVCQPSNSIATKTVLVARSHAFHQGRPGGSQHAVHSTEVVLFASAKDIQQSTSYIAVLLLIFSRLELSFSADLHFDDSRDSSRHKLLAPSSTIFSERRSL